MLTMGMPLTNYFDEGHGFEPFPHYKVIAIFFIENVAVTKIYRELPHHTLTPFLVCKWVSNCSISNYAVFNTLGC